MKESWRIMKRRLIYYKQLWMIHNHVYKEFLKKGKDVSKIQSGCGNDCLNCKEEGCEKRFYDTTIDDKEEN